MPREIRFDGRAHRINSLLCIKTECFPKIHLAHGPHITAFPTAQAHTFFFLPFTTFILH